MKAVLSMTLGVMTAIGGFVDIGNLVTSGITGARFGMTLTWAVVVGTAGMMLFAEMAGRVTAVTRKPIFHRDPATITSYAPEPALPMTVSPPVPRMAGLGLGSCGRADY